MKGSLLVLSMFFVGCVLGYVWNFSGWELGDTHHLSMYILYALMFQVGVSIGGGEDFKELLRGFRPKMLLIPLATIGGTLLFSALVSVLLTRWSVFDCLAVGSGLGYYSLSSILIMELKTPDLGAQLATELATIALLTNVIRELVALVGAPFICKYFGKLNFGRCSSSLHYPCVWKGNGTPCHLPRAAGRHVRAVFHFFVLQAVEGIPRLQSKEMKTAAGSLRCPCP